MRMLHIVIVAWQALKYFFHIISQRARFSKKGYWTQNVCFDILYNFLLKYLSFSEEMREICLHVKYPLFLSDF